MNKKIPDEVIEYIKEIAQGRHIKEITRMTNERFLDKGYIFTKAQVESIKQRYHIRSGRKRQNWLDKKYGPEFDEFVQKNVKGRTVEELTKIVNKKFGCDLTEMQVRAYKKKKKYTSDIDMRFKKGDVCWCKGMKMPPGWGGVETRFRKGCIPHNYKEIGTESISAEGYVFVKVQDTGTQNERWRQKHILVWEEHNGPVPDGGIITFLDGNKMNCDISNLALITRKEHIELVRQKLRFEDREMTRTGINVAKLSVAIKERSKK